MDGPWDAKGSSHMHDSTTPSGPSDTAEITDAHLRWITTALGVGAIASILDSTIVNVGIDYLARVFHASLSQTQWVLTSFLLAMTAVVPLTGWLIDRIGAKQMWLLSLTIFLAGSIACSAAGDLAGLIVFRSVQGLGAGLILPALMTLLTLCAGQRRLMTAMAGFSLIAQVGPVLGPVLGGIILHGASWRWLFLVNIPFCVVGLAWAARIVPTTPRSPSPRPLDLPGLLLSAPAVTAFIYGLSRIQPGTGLDAPAVWGPVAVAVLLASAFVAWSLHRRGDAILDVRLFSDRSFRAGSALTVLAGLTMFGGLLLLPLYFQVIEHDDVLTAALWLVPQGLGAATLILAFGNVTKKLSPRVRIAAGFALISAGTIPFAVAAARSHAALLVLALFVRGLGIGASNPAINAAALAGLAPADVPHGTTAFTIVQRLGAPLGTTLITLVLTHAMTHHSPADAFSLAFWVTTACAALPIPVAWTLGDPRHR